VSGTADVMDQAEFLDTVASLTERWGELSEGEARRLFRWLTDRLDTAEIREAFGRLWAAWEFPRWPPAIAFLDAVRTTPGSVALDDWAEILESVTTGETGGLYTRISAAGVKAIKSIGGVEALRSESALPFARRDFLEAHGEFFIQERRRLLDAPSGGRAYLPSADP
jgi:hypothetical protein